MEELELSVRLGGVLAATLGPRRTVRLAAPADVDALLRALAAEAGLSEQAVASLAVSRGGRLLGRDATLEHGAELAVLVPVSGG